MLVTGRCSVTSDATNSCTVLGGREDVYVKMQPVILYNISGKKVKKSHYRSGLKLPNFKTFGI
jgi:hypothetical protein